MYFQFQSIFNVTGNQALVPLKKINYTILFTGISGVNVKDHLQSPFKEWRWLYSLRADTRKVVSHMTVREPGMCLYFQIKTRRGRECTFDMQQLEFDKVENVEGKAFKTGKYW